MKDLIVQQLRDLRYDGRGRAVDLGTVVAPVRRVGPAVVLPLRLPPPRHAAVGPAIAAVVLHHRPLPNGEDLPAAAGMTRGGGPAGGRDRRGRGLVHRGRRGGRRAFVPDLVPRPEFVDAVPLPPPVLGHELAEEPDLLRLVLGQKRPVSSLVRPGLAA